MKNFRKKKEFRKDRSEIIFFWQVVDNEKQSNETTMKKSENWLSKYVQTKFSTHLDKKKNLAQSISSDSQNSNKKDHSTKFSKSTSSRIFKKK